MVKRSTPTETDRVFTERFEEHYKDRGGVDKFLVMVDEAKGLQAAAEHFGFSPAYASIVYKKLRGSSYSTDNPEGSLEPRRRIKRINPHTVPGQAMGAVMEKLKTFGVLDLSLTNRKSRVMVDGKECLILVRGAREMSKTGGERTIQRYMYFNVTAPHQEDPWEFLIGVAFISRGDGQLPRYYVIPVADLQGRTSVYIPVIYLKPTESVPVGHPGYRPPITGTYKFEKYKEAWGPLLDRLGIPLQKAGNA